MKRHELDDMEVIIVADPEDVKKHEKFKKEMDEMFGELNKSIIEHEKLVRKLNRKNIIKASLTTLGVGIAIGIYVDQHYL